ncbi:MULTISPECIES: hypothetical protein [unclassified Enterococcus]|uniref:hypothetical protein n=1 Tax=unclassified Enterococcus TaxID=2608891 RepID=UPI001A927107|nr:MULTISPECIES: hypothetical protein [unclassified Enterococcus]MBO0462506.1 hypothetical protein [Enterococcus sp. DIV1298c]MBO1300228.1 hypothetical protein [Enterococcus sp. DIV1271a]
MDQNRYLSKFIYQLESGKVNYGDKPLGTNHIVIGTLNTDKDKIGNESKPKKNSTQAMVVAELKDRYKALDNEDLKKIKGFPDSVITKKLTIAYAGTTSVKDWHTNFVEIWENNKHSNGVFFFTLNYVAKLKSITQS